MDFRSVNPRGIDISIGYLGQQDAASLHELHPKLIAKAGKFWYLPANSSSDWEFHIVELDRILDGNVVSYYKLPEEYRLYAGYLLVLLNEGWVRLELIPELTPEQVLSLFGSYQDWITSE